MSQMDLIESPIMIGFVLATLVFSIMVFASMTKVLSFKFIMGKIIGPTITGLAFAGKFILKAFGLG